MSLESTTESQVTAYLITMNKHLEDLDNRGRRQNIRVGGIPETINSDQIASAVQSAFNKLLDKPSDTPID